MELLFLLCCGLLFAASLLGSGVLFKHQRLTTWLAAAGAIFQSQWLLLTLLGGRFLSFETVHFFLGGSSVLLVFWLMCLKWWTTPNWRKFPGLDLGVLLVTLVIIINALAVAARNGFSEGQWIMHGFYNGDTVTFISLVQQAILNNGLVANPFAANGYLEYPTLLHRGFALFWQATKLNLQWLYYLPAITIWQIIITTPLFFLWWDTVVPAPTLPERWLGFKSSWVSLLQIPILMVVLGLSWDNYIYPQTHFFLTALFLLQASLLYQAFSATRLHQYLLICTASVIAVILLLANAVTGTAGLALLLLFSILRVTDNARQRAERIVFLGSLVLSLSMFMIFTPGQAALGLPGFSYTATEGYLPLAVVLIIILIAAALHGQLWLTASIVGLIGLSFFTFFFSSRPLVVANASRFSYHAILLGFPLLLFLLVRAFAWLRREFVYTSHSVAEKGVLVGMVIAVLLIMILPPLASIATSLDHLLFRDAHVVSNSRRQALDWIEQNTANDAVILSSPYAPWDIPLFTGRALLRASHEASAFWLSPDDVVLSDHRAAFRGDLAAQEKVAALADYLVLSTADKGIWEPRQLPKVFENGSTSIYRLP